MGPNSLRQGKLNNFLAKASDRLTSRRSSLARLADYCLIWPKAVFEFTQREATRLTIDQNVGGFVLEFLDRSLVRSIGGQLPAAYREGTRSRQQVHTRIHKFSLRKHFGSREGERAGSTQSADLIYMPLNDYDPSLTNCRAALDGPFDHR